MTHGFKDTTPELYRYSMHVATGVTTATCLVPGRAADFPVVPAQLLGRRSRFAYCAVAGTDETDDEGGDQQHMCVAPAFTCAALLPIPRTPSPPRERARALARPS